MYSGEACSPMFERECCRQFMHEARRVKGVRLRAGVHVRRREGGMTLIELLVVASVIALLLSILLPSLNQARRQTRTAQCATRMAELTRAVILYAMDNNGLPPFIGRGWEDLDDRNNEEWPAGSGLTVDDLKRLENWQVNHPELVWFTREVDWPLDVGVRFGSLFGYTRFPEIYRCPEFERIPTQQKSQSAFNYTRTVLARKWYVPQIDPEAKNSPSAFGCPGPLLEIEEVYSPAKMGMFVDEWWLRHCAAPENENVLNNPPMITGGWMAQDCMNFYLGDELGRYHGRPVAGLASNDGPTKVALGNVSHYDGHVELFRDVFPGRTIDLSVGVDQIKQLLNFLADHLFAQRGVTVDIEKVAEEAQASTNH